jgi:hypothetical protein
MPEPRDDTSIFDRSFKLIIDSLSNRALITLINVLFGADHPLNSDVRCLNTEQIDKSLRKWPADEIISINGLNYMSDQQTTDDANTAICIFEYGYAHALKNRITTDGVIILSYPRAIEIYLKTGTATPDELTVMLIFPDGSGHDFTVKTVKLPDYGVEELPGRGFTPLLPFYILKVAQGGEADTFLLRLSEKYPKHK